MIVLCSDFGLEGPYTGQVKAVLQRAAPGAPVDRSVRRSARGKAQARGLSAGRLRGVVSAGDGAARGGRSRSGQRAGRNHRRGRWALVCRPGQRLVRAGSAPRRSSPELGNPRAAGGDFGDLPRPRSVRAGGRPAGSRRMPAAPPRADGIGRQPDWPDDLPEIVYVDRYGNAMTGMRALLLPSGAVLAASGRVLRRARTFSDVPAGRGLLVRELERPRRNRRQCRAGRRRSRHRRSERRSTILR